MRNGYAEYGIPAGYYDRDGKPMPLMCWANIGPTPYMFVARTGFGPDERDGFVSTIWTGIPAAVCMPPPGLIFETMVFATASTLHEHRLLHSDLGQAIEMHDMIALSVAYELEGR
jgi:hypothetical protein